MHTFMMQHYFEQRAKRIIVASAQDCFWELMFQKYKTFSAYLASPDCQSQSKQQIESSIGSKRPRHDMESQAVNKENKKVVEQQAVAKPIRRQLATPQKLGRSTNVKSTSVVGPETSSPATISSTVFQF